MGKSENPLFLWPFSIAMLVYQRLIPVGDSWCHDACVIDVHGVHGLPAESPKKINSLHSLHPAVSLRFGTLDQPLQVGVPENPGGHRWATPRQQEYVFKNENLGGKLIIKNGASLHTKLLDFQPPVLKSARSANFTAFDTRSDSWTYLKWSPMDPWPNPKPKLPIKSH